jgi:DNA-binding transcriptional LysR family regulator
LAKEYPQLRLELAVATQSLNLSRREADVAVRMFRPWEEALAARKLATLRFALYASRAYVAQRGRPRLDELRRHTVLGYDDSLAQTAEKQWLDRMADGARVPFRSNSRASMMAAVRSGIGLTVLPCYLADPEPDLVRLCDPSEVPTREMWLAVHVDLQRTPRVRAAMEFVAGGFKAAAPRL